MTLNAAETTAPKTACPPNETAPFEPLPPLPEPEPEPELPPPEPVLPVGDEPAEVDAGAEGVNVEG